MNVQHYPDKMLSVVVVVVVVMVMVVVYSNTLTRC